jgi:thiol-disulfide isomerase/thioredoxin
MSYFRMMKYTILIFTVLLLNCKEPSQETAETVNSVTERIESDVLEIYDYEGVKKYLHLEDDTVYIVNFWATWCAPCVKELPYFEEIGENYKDKNVEVILISLDFPKHYDSKLKPFLKKHNLNSKVLVLNDTDMNTWIPKVHADWSGAIPATLIYNKDKRQFYEQSFSYDELKAEVDKFLN